MKKVFVLFLVLLLVASAAFAGTVSNTAGDATVKASLDLSGGEGDAGFVKFGFYSGTAPEGFSITTSDGIQITDNKVKLYPKVETTENKSSLIATNLAGEGSNDEFYLFYQILSGTKYTLTLSLDEKMKVDSTPTLDWTVTLDDESSKSVSTVNNKSVPLLTHDPATETDPTVSSAAAYNVSITTAAIEGLKQGTYEGTIKLTLTTEGAGAGA